MSADRQAAAAAAAPAPSGEGGAGPQVVEVPLGARSYRILVGAGLVTGAGGHLQEAGAPRQAAIVTDANVAARHLPALQESLARAGIAAHVHVIEPGERSKSFAVFERLCEWLLQVRIERRDAVLAFGGGVVGDLAGFAAAVLRRGTRLVQVPTTLLAQVDSAVGGKTAINTRFGKNLIGAFHQPDLVLADTGMLDSLPRREVLAGYAEILKYGLLGDTAFLDWLSRHGAAVIDGSDGGAARAEAIARSCRAKAAIVAGDERETGDRALLNLGHTFAHALEAEAGMAGGVLHGEAVAVGLLCAAMLSARLGLATEGDVARVRHDLQAAGLPHSLAGIGGADWPAGRLLEHMRQDKKAAGGKLRFVLLRGLGAAFVADGVAEAEVLAVLDAVRAPGNTA
ncbi:MAG: 3-dehydroquinate synthase [Sneathiellaceae bacterium]